MVKIIKNDSRYITSDTLNKLFVKGEIVRVDKVVTGNGATTAFIKNPPPPDECYILTAPNLPVIFEKQRAYSNGEYDVKKYGEAGKEILVRPKIKFIHGKSSEQIKKTDKGYIYIIIADLFVSSFDKINEMSQITRIMIDEYHTVEQQSVFRPKLVKLYTNLPKLKSKTRAIVTITATPNMLSQIDVKIVNKYIHPYEINYTKSMVRSITRLQSYLAQGYKVVIGSNNLKILNMIATRSRLKGDRLQTIHASVHVGATFNQKLSITKVIDEENPNLVVLSSAAFEGFDIIPAKGEKYVMFMFEDRTIKEYTYSQANVYQFFSRVRIRENVEYMEYCSLGAQPRGTLVATLDKRLTDIINDRTISNVKKTSSKYKGSDLVRRFCIVDYESTSKIDKFHDAKLTINRVLVNLFKEKVSFDESFQQTFLDDRKITIVDLAEQPNRLKLRYKADLATVDSYIQANMDYIINHDIFGENYLLNMNVDVPSKSDGRSIAEINVNYMEIFRKCKNFDGKYSNETLDKAINILRDPDQLKSLLDELRKAYNSYIDEKNAGGYYKWDAFNLKKRTQDEIKTHLKNLRADFEESSEKIAVALLKAWSSGDFNFRAKRVGYRVYSYLTDHGLPLHHVVASALKIRFAEFDIRSAFPRFLYANAGLKLPDNFYGENKKNKVTINVILNSLHIPTQLYRAQKRGIKTDSRKLRYKLKLTLQKLNFDDRVIEYLINNYFNSTHNEDFFNHMSFNELKLISEIKSFIESIEYRFDAIIRRHDSFIVVGASDEVLNIILNEVKNYSFLGQSDYFDRYNKYGDTTVEIKDPEVMDKTVKDWCDEPSEYQVEVNKLIINGISYDTIITESDLMQTRVLKDDDILKQVEILTLDR